VATPRHTAVWHWTRAGRADAHPAREHSQRESTPGWRKFECRTGRPCALTNTNTSGPVVESTDVDSAQDGRTGPVLGIRRHSLVKHQLRQDNRQAKQAGQPLRETRPYRFKPAPPATLPPAPAVIAPLRAASAPGRVHHRHRGSETFWPSVHARFTAWSGDSLVTPACRFRRAGAPDTSTPTGAISTSWRSGAGLRRPAGRLPHRVPGGRRHHPPGRRPRVLRSQACGDARACGPGPWRGADTRTSHPLAVTDLPRCPRP